MKISKILCLLLAVCLSLGAFVSCGEEKSSETNESVIETNEPENTDEITDSLETENLETNEPMWDDSAADEPAEDVEIADCEVYVSKLHRDGNTASADVTYTDEEIIADAESYEEWAASQSYLNGESMAFRPYVKNTGNVDIYVSITVKIPSVLGISCSEDKFANPKAFANDDYAKMFTWAQPEEETYFANGKTAGREIYQFVTKVPLAPGEMTYWSVWDYISVKAEEYAEYMDMFRDFGAVDENGRADITVECKCIAAEGFDNEVDAFMAMY